VIGEIQELATRPELVRPFSVREIKRREVNRRGRGRRVWGSAVTVEGLGAGTPQTRSADSAFGEVRPAGFSMVSGCGDPNGIKPRTRTAFCRALRSST
jgi:hypothetical protein